MWLQAVGAIKTDKSKVSLVVNGAVKATGTVSGSTAVTYDAFQFNAATDADAEGIVKLEEKGGYELYIDGVKVDGAFSAAASQPITGDYQGGEEFVSVDTKTIALADSDLTTATKKITAAVDSDGAKKLTIDLSGLTADENGRINLVSMAKFQQDFTTVTLEEDADEMIKSFVVAVSGVATDETTGGSISGLDSGDVTFYIKKGAKMIVTSTVTSSNALSTTADYMGVTVDDATEATKVSTTEWTASSSDYTGEFTWTVTGEKAAIAMVITTETT